MERLRRYEEKQQTLPASARRRIQRKVRMRLKDMAENYSKLCVLNNLPGGEEER